ncbi:Ankyrin repeat domain-containing protein 50 [Apiospora saccharicola]|uniref:Ankyrin repeat domain-containing protein 50 n=1 Tax=Apiospora saccharicola TaxID=335842 RepID=A0ABR1U174_9PEZI
MPSHTVFEEAITGHNNLAGINNQGTLHINFDGPRETGERSDIARQKCEKQEHRRVLLESLRFSQMDVRQISVKKAYAKTCRWFLQDPEYLQWSENDGMHDPGRFLWIKGKPGAGKSIMMKFLLDQAHRTKKEHAIISFFFNARGSDLEKSTPGLYRSLLVQLLESYPDLQQILDRVRSGHQWTIESLQRLLEESIESINRAPLMCFIDALDECQSEQVRDMIKYFSGLCEAGNRIHICFASRHYPHITITNGRSIILEEKEQHRQDIASYIDSALRIGEGKIVEDIKSGLQEKALGVFMWVVLVVDILNKEQPLSPRQLYFAILSGLEPENLSECHTDEITDDDVAKFVLDNSKGLAESTKSKLPTIQFIHESVRDFLLKDNGLQAIWSDAGINVEGKCHEALKQACFAYMSSEPVACLFDSLPKPKANSAETNQKREDVNNQVPFLEYANQSILSHANTAATYGYSQTDFLTSFPLTEWVLHHNCFQRHQIRHYTPVVSLRYVLVEGNHDGLIRDQRTPQLCFDVEWERYGTPLFAALATKSTGAVQALIEGQQLGKMANSSLENVQIQTTDYEDWCGVFSRSFSFSSQKGVVSHLVKAGEMKLLRVFCGTEHFDVRSKDRRDWPPLSYAADKGHFDIARLLIERGADVNAADKDGWTPLIRASSGGYIDIARLLIGRGADVNAADKNGWTPFTRALNAGYIDVARLLIERGADVNAIDKDGWTPLTRVLIRGCGEVARLLIKQGADVNATNPSGWTPLTRASSGGHINMAKLLIERGADVNAADSSGWTPLIYAAYKRHFYVARDMLVRDADLYPVRLSEWKPSTSGGYIDVARLLIERGADVNAADKDRRTPLTWALDRGYVNIARLLIERGADVDVASKDGWTPLTRALNKGYVDIAKLLIEQGADRNV